MSFQARRFVFTINNYGVSDLIAVRSAVDGGWGCTYMCFGLEIGPREGIPHIQGYLELDHRMRASAVNNRLGNRAHLERANGSYESNKKYCSKTRDEDDEPNEVFEEYGNHNSALEPKPKRKRGPDYESAISLLESGANIKDVIVKHPELAVKHLPNLIKIRSIMASSMDISPYHGPFPWSTPPGFAPSEQWRRCLWLRGPSGIGKTQFAVSLLEKPLFVRHIDQLKKFCPADYGGIIFDDMNFAHWPREAQIQLLDLEMPTAIHVRYGIVELPAYTKRIFTSNVDIFLEDPAIRRRYHRVNFN